MDAVKAGGSLRSIAIDSYEVKMKAIIGSALLALPAVLAVPTAGEGGWKHHGGHGHGESVAIGADDFVYIDGLQLKDNDGVYYLTGNSPDAPDVIPTPMRG